MVRVKDRQMLLDAWKIETGGSGGKPYYAFEIEDLKLGGERNWNARWNIMRRLSFMGKAVLELGCNVGLFSIYAIEDGGAKRATGVDLPDAVMVERRKPSRITAARMVNAALGSSVVYRPVDMNTQKYEEILGTDYDVVFCMSFFKWIDDKDRFLEYLSNFNAIVYEGHESDEVESARFSDYGFSSTILGRTQIGKSYKPDAFRTLMLMQKRSK